MQSHYITGAKGTLTRLLSKATNVGLVALLLFAAYAPTLRPIKASATGYACNSVKADLWFGNDESGSVDAGEFNDALDFMYQISDSFAYDAVNGVQAGAFAWDTTTNDVIIPITEDFSDTDDTGLIRDANVSVDSDSKGVRELYTTKAGGGGTDLTVATQRMADLIDAGNGRRTGVPQIGIILTDATSGQLTGDSANWITAADSLRSAGDSGVGIVLVLIAEAATAYAGAAKTTVDAVAGTGGLVVTVPTYSDAADPAKGYIDDVTGAICDTIETIAGPVADNDNITSTEEDAGPNGGDGNNDGTADSEQADVTTAINNRVGGYTTTEISGDCHQVTAVNFYAESALSSTDPDYEYPYGLHGFNVDCTATGGTVNVKYFWDKQYDVSGWTYRKYNQATNSYINFNDRVTYGTAVIGGKTVTTVSYSVTDGGPYDGDGVANGSILDPVGPTVLAVSTPDTGIEKTSNLQLLLLVLAGFGLLVAASVHYAYRTRRTTPGSSAS